MDSKKVTIAVPKGLTLFFHFHFLFPLLDHAVESVFFLLLLHVEIKEEKEDDDDES